MLLYVKNRNSKYCYNIDDDYYKLVDESTFINHDGKIINSDDITIIMFEYNDPIIFKLTFINVREAYFYQDPHCKKFLINNSHIKRLIIDCANSIYKSIISQSFVDYLSTMNLEFLNINNCYFENDTCILETFIPNIILQNCYLTHYMCNNVWYNCDFSNIMLSHGIKQIINNFVHDDGCVIVK